jgi:hypothetical protein
MKTKNKSKRNQVTTYNIHSQERQLPRNKHRSNSPTTGRIRKVLNTTLWPQTELESTHYKKRKQTDLKAKETNWLIGKKSNLSIKNKILVYKAVIKLIWTYWIELWGCASKSKTAIMQRAKSKILRTITNAPWYVTNRTLHTDLNIPYVSDVINERINKHLSKLQSHPNTLVETLKQPTRNRRLKRRWTSDLHD